MIFSNTVNDLKYEREKKTNVSLVKSEKEIPNLQIWQQNQFY